MKDPQVKRQHCSYEDIEKNPEQYGIHERFSVQIALEMKIAERESRSPDDKPPGEAARNDNTLFYLTLIE